MTKYKIKLFNPDEMLDTTIICENHQSILEASEENNIELPYSCRAGSCSTCLGKLIQGTIDQTDQSFLDKEQIDKGYILTCVSTPTSDCTILTHKEGNLY